MTRMNGAAFPLSMETTEAARTALLARTHRLTYNGLDGERYTARVRKEGPVKFLDVQRADGAPFLVAGRTVTAWQPITSSPEVANLVDATARDEAAAATVEPIGNGQHPLSMEIEAAPPSMERRRDPALARLLRRLLAMRKQRRLDLLALDAAGDRLREVEPARLAPTHQDQEPGYPAIAMLHRERETSARALATERQRAAALERANALLAAEVERLAGRAIRAEQALLVAHMPAARASTAGPRR